MDQDVWALEYAAAEVKSDREFVPEGLSRRFAKNAIPVLECEEVLDAAFWRFMER